MIDDYFKVGDSILYGKFQSKHGIISKAYVDERGVPMIEIEPVPKGRKHTKVIPLYRIRHAPAIIEKVAARYYLREEVQKLSQIRTASVHGREITAEVLHAFIQDAKIASMKQAVNMLKKIKQVWSLFTSHEDAWEGFKEILGIKSLDQIPQAIKRFLSVGKQTLQKVGDRLIDSIPVLKIYLDASKKLPSIGKLIDTMIEKLPPSVQKALESISSKFHSLAAWMDHLLFEHAYLKPIGVVSSAALFTYIWFNVVELSWDIPEILKGFLGLYTFTEILHSLPESIVGLIIGLMFPGIPSGLLWNAVLPITVAMRVAWLMHEDLAVYKNGVLRFLPRALTV